MEYLLTHLNTLAPLALGVLFGSLLFFSGWKGSAEGEDHHSDNRILAAKYGLTGLVATLAAGFFYPEGEGVAPISQFTFGGLYVIGFVVGWVVFFAIVGGGLFLSSVVKNDSLNSPPPAVDTVIDFFMYGYAYAKAERKKAEDESGQHQTQLEGERKKVEDMAAQHQKELENMLEAFEYFRDTSLNRSSALTTSIGLAADYLRNPNPDNQHMQIQFILAKICAEAEPYFQDDEEDARLQVGADLMLSVPYFDADKKLRDAALFTFGSTERYGYLLHLKPEAIVGDLIPKNEVVLPVENPDVTQDWREWALPGAPRAFLEQSAVVVGGEPEFGSQIPTKIHQGIEQYIEQQRFNCFISINIPIAKADNRPIGIVNVHSNHAGLLALDESGLNELGLLLTPYCAILGLILRRSE